MILSCPFCREKCAKGKRTCPKCHQQMTRPCPHCEEEISVLAALCKYCGEAVEAALTPHEPQPEIVFLDAAPKKRRCRGAWIALLLIGILSAVGLFAYLRL